MTAQAGQIGPNAILQLVPVLEEEAGPDVTAHLLSMAGVIRMPDPAEGLIDEGPAARLHQAMRAEMPEAAPLLAREAGKRTGDYILAHRIPAKAQAILRFLPARLAAPILARAVAKHAWTFCGSGAFRLVSTWPVVFEIGDNPVVRGERSDVPLCHWHAAVFARLFSELCGPGWQCEEVACCAQGAEVCRFEMTRAR
ncbi:Protein BchJ, involved in reduction of C-8 vinyl of divinyl protochlorophyllide [Roseibacterium elongatum DSM 19469]|uniref:Protein BchJ, involved in reduction of C-8 vinyl of divinyl protochlorophyllide n=1 Tax=Roseicyclus elongatus DSM 19469 TaxID=1294273 RepID=W8RNJ4_9RHOB|nr:bacteriochlorophyll 4-vinyl reductase [Roseibacterium elongatum]AHM02724.1 Protein BchJ, involved in reduction of C-8 vinyl of divinyl protochlorophyllide [Roseibacterium elongatum DSM 19469]